MIYESENTQQTGTTHLPRDTGLRNDSCQEGEREHRVKQHQRKA
jgi:hypothetical protein